MYRLVALFALVGLTACSTGSFDEVVSIDNGHLAGQVEGDVIVYRGVPFAAPPVGELRWRRPQPAPSWTGVRRADAFAPACVQEGVSMPGEPVPRTSEDCLYLNIWRPLRRADEPLPVMVWIYGGGFSNGATSYALYSGEGLASRGVIVVNIAYRVGPLGFLAHPELTAESPEGVSGNYGLLDQIAALQWVRENIDAFGGDAGNVTVFGQSAGATSISALMASPLAEGLFHRAIGQSGGLFEPLEIAPRYELSNAELDGEAYAASLGVSSLPELRALPAGALFEGQAGMVTHPVIDSYVLPEVPYDVFSSGRQHRVPVLVGSNADEARSLMADPEEIRAETFATEIAARWGQLPAPLMEAYAFETDDEARQAASDFERDLRFGWDVWTWARLTAAAGEPAFYYYFTHEPPFPRGSLYEDWGASHFAELWYMFDHLNQESWSWAESDTVLANLMTAYWTNFAKSGDPNAAGLPEWPRFTNESERVLYLATPVSVGGVPNLETLQVFDSVYSTIRQQD